MNTCKEHLSMKLDLKVLKWMVGTNLVTNGAIGAVIGILIYLK